MPYDFDRVKEFLVCPTCKSDLVHDGDALVCVNPEARMSFPIVDEIPRLLAEESSELSQDEWSSAMTRNNRDPETGQTAPPSP